MAEKAGPERDQEEAGGGFREAPVELTRDRRVMPGEDRLRRLDGIEGACRCNTECDGCGEDDGVRPRGL